eukprot:CAMPEP_0195087360 /NCGR_PEP_ID=MMETSP0448-20130528/27221_1 /TAXON_ID=66468 /ORGANISM="Heterocapsa triquestra, Strain CCMP 448" /LENGTH=271 /DNA_ID=CAMNT_0040120921 /DNA_START=37 /DNA_END=852 /DNA_ORIENTATION=-
MTSPYLVVGAFAFMVAMNVLASRRAFGGKDNKELSDEHPTYLSPDGLTFAVWGMIYLLEAVLVVGQAIPSERTDKLMSPTCPVTGLDVRGRLVLAFALNGVWLPTFNNELFWIALGIMSLYLAVLASAYGDLNASKTNGVLEQTVFTAGLAMNTSWIIVASLVSVFFCGGEAGWKDEYGVAGSVPVAMVLAGLVALLGCERALRSVDLPWAFVAGWALRGIFRMQTIPDKVRFPIGAMSPTLGQSARLASMAVWLAMAAGAGRSLYSSMLR